MLVAAASVSSVVLSQPVLADYSLGNYSFSSAPGATSPHAWGDTVTGFASPGGSGGQGGITADSTANSGPSNDSRGSSYTEYVWNPSYSGEAPKDYHGIYQYAYQANINGNMGASDFAYGSYYGNTTGGSRYGMYRVENGATNQSGVTVETVQLRRPGGQVVSESTNTSMHWEARTNAIPQEYIQYGANVVTFSLHQQGQTDFTMQFLYE